MISKIIREIAIISIVLLAFLLVSSALSLWLRMLLGLLVGMGTARLVEVVERWVDGGKRDGS